MKISPTSLPGVLLIESPVFADKRGFFTEIYHRRKYDELAIEYTFVQDNLSHSVRGTLRGLHYQFPRAQAKLIQVIRGEIFDVAVDIRRGSPTFGRWMGVHLSAENSRQVFIPEGFAHGFCVLSETADVLYKCTDFYAPEDEGGILWCDLGIGVEWPITAPLLSEKDSAYPCLDEVSQDRLPAYEEGK